MPTVLSCVPAVHFAEDDQLGALILDDTGRVTAAADHVALPGAWVEAVAAGHVPRATLRHPAAGFTEAGIRFGAVLRLDDPDGPVLYRLAGYRGPTSAAWFCDRIRD